MIAQKIGSTSLKLVLPFPPASGNHQHARGRYGNVYVRNAITNYRLLVRAAVLRQFQGVKFSSLLPITGKCDIEIHVVPPDRRRRDKDNLEKVVLDAITLAGVWADDSLIADKIHRDWLKPSRALAHVAVSISPREGDA